LGVALLLSFAESPEQLGETESGRVLAAESDEDEADAHLAEVLERHRRGVVEPLERARVVEREPGFRKAPPDGGRELLDRLPIGRRELAPQEIGDATVEVAQTAFDRE